MVAISIVLYCFGTFWWNILPTNVASYYKAIEIWKPKTHWTRHSLILYNPFHQNQIPCHSALRHCEQPINTACSCSLRSLPLTYELTKASREMVSFNMLPYLYFLQCRVTHCPDLPYMVSMPGSMKFDWTFHSRLIVLPHGRVHRSLNKKHCIGLWLCN